MLAALGGAGGLMAAYASLQALVALATGSLPRLNEVRLDWRALAFTAGVSLASGLLFGLGPALGISRANLRETLNTRGGTRILRNAQAAAQIAIAFVLLAGAGLLLRSFRAIRAVDLGFRTEHVLSANFALPPSRYAGPPEYVQFVESVLAQVRGVPGVLSATATLGVPMRGSAGGKFEVFGRPAEGREPPGAEFRPGDADYFATLGMTIERGRGFMARDVEGAAPVALINQKLARTQFAGEDPLGKRIRMVDKNGAKPWMTIVGVIRDTRHVGPLRDSLDEVYVPFAQFGSTGLQPRALIVRSVGDPERLVPALQRAVASVDKDQPLVAIGTLDQSLAEFLAPQRFDTTLMAIFAAIGLALAAVGIFGVMSYGVTRRTQEIGVRMALGANRRRVLGMVLGDGLRIAAVGLAAGWAGAWALTRYLTSLLFGVTAGDPVTLAAASAVAVTAAIGASYWPALRASRVDPMTALRAE
jgi:putative ABC transport system permease protein